MSHPATQEEVRAAIQSEPFRSDALWLKSLIRAVPQRPELIEKARALLEERYGPELAAALVEWEEA